MKKNKLFTMQTEECQSALETAHFFFHRLQYPVFVCNFC